MDANEAETISPPLPANRVYAKRFYHVKDGVLVNPGFIRYPVGTFPAERPVDFCIPSEHPELPQALANAHNEKDALAFVRQYGLLGHDEMAPPEEYKGGDPVDWFLCHATTVRLLLELTELLEQEDVAALEQALNVGGNYAPVESGQQEAEFFGNSAAWVEYAVRHKIVPQTAIGGVDRDVLSFARDMRRRIINANIRDVYLVLHKVDDKEIIVEGISALIEGIYLQVVNIVTQNRKVRRCAAPDCHRFFVQNTKRQKFCPPEKGFDSRCAQRIRKRGIRQH